MGPILCCARGLLPRRIIVDHIYSGAPTRTREIEAEALVSPAPFPLEQRSPVGREFCEHSGQSISPAVHPGKANRTHTGREILGQLLYRRTLGNQSMAIIVDRSETLLPLLAISRMRCVDAQRRVVPVVSQADCLTLE